MKHKSGFAMRRQGQLITSRMGLRRYKEMEILVTNECIGPEAIE